MMELSVSGRMRRAAQAANPQPKTETKLSSGKTSVQQNKTDRLSLSKQALSFLQELNRQEQEQQRKLLEAKRQGSDELDALTKSLKVMEKCRKIAARIQAGDKVPPEDEQYLMDNDSLSYKLAMAMRKPKEDPKKWDSVLEEEDKAGGGTVSSAEPSSGEASSDPVE